MNIDFAEIQNFRRLAAIRIDFSENTTLLVGANNSGKTSAITALRYFLIQQNAFSIYDIPLPLWTGIDELGKAFENGDNKELRDKWKNLLPSLDVWLNISESEIHYVAHLIPTLDWTPDKGIGVRLQLEPQDQDELLKAYLKAKKTADTLISEQPDNKPAEPDKGQIEPQLGEPNKKFGKFALWPDNLTDFLKKRIASFLTVKAYLLDPSKKVDPKDGVARPQKLTVDAILLDDNPFKGLIRIDEIPAHRGFGDYSGTNPDSDESELGEKGRKQILTAQLRAYYGKHLDPSKAPEPSDIQALQAIHEAQSAFDARLKDCFKMPLDELEGLGYPGIANPRLIISTALKPVEGLKHQTAVQYEVAPTPGKEAAPYRLPEQCNGLGYQNLISMVFRLISFRDDWMRVGKAARTDGEAGDGYSSPPPLHFVLLEEPEAHLHVQVQQVFIRKAYEVLRNHPNLQDKSPLSTQLLISSHSSHVAHEVDFAHMRYFRRHPARNSGETPTSTVVNLSEVFGTPNETARFVSRYLQATHADLLFADGAILVEGAAERMLVPHFIRHHYQKLHSCYLTVLEIGGSHAHRLAPLIKHLGLNTLIITDLDSVNPASRSKTYPERGTGLLTANNVLKKWYPKKESIDELLDLKECQKAYDENFSIRVAYQMPMQAALRTSDPKSEIIPRTFEDALVFENIDLFRQTNGVGLLNKFGDAVASADNLAGLGKALFDALGTGSKAEFALEMLVSKDPASIKAPEYIRKGLDWLETKLLERQREVPTTQCKDAQSAVGSVL